MNKTLSGHRIVSCPHCGDTNLITLAVLLEDTSIDYRGCAKFMGAWADLSRPAPRDEWDEHGRFAIHEGLHS